jgi:hypothetical protein
MASVFVRASSSLAKRAVRSGLSSATTNPCAASVANRFFQ